MWKNYIYVNGVTHKFYNPKQIEISRPSAVSI